MEIDEIFIGVDGGASKSIIRAEDKKGNCLAEVESGPASLRLSVLQAWESIRIGCEKVIVTKTQTKKPILHLGLGLAGCEIHSAKDEFLNQSHFFQTVVLNTDAYIAWLAAHGGADGALIIAGTGAVGIQFEQGVETKVSGWGFPHDDTGSGAGIGLDAIRATLECLDGREAEGLITKYLFAYFQKDLDHLVNWSNQANSTAFATLAPFVIKCAHQGDELALTILKKHAGAIDKIANALLKAQANPEAPLPCAFSGGISASLKEFLSPTLRIRLTPMKQSPAQAAIQMVKQKLSG